LSARGRRSTASSDRNSDQQDHEPLRDAPAAEHHVPGLERRRDDDADEEQEEDVEQQVGDGAMATMPITIAAAAICRRSMVPGLFAPSLIQHWLRSTRRFSL
jgi:hypothetical protein